MKRAVPMFLRTLSVVSALFLAQVSLPAWAQTTAKVISPLTVESDPNGVNITTGEARVTTPTISVPAAPRISFGLIQDAMPHLVAKISGVPGSYVESSVAVHTGSSASESFQCSYDDVCTNRKLNGAALDGSIAVGGPYTFTESGTGAIYTFNKLEFDSGPASPRQVQYYASSIAYPDGEVISLTYETGNYASAQGRTFHRLTQMSSSIGYYLTFSYQGNDVNLGLWSVLAQATLYKATAPSTPLGQLTYGGANGTITDLAGRVFTCTGCINAVGAKVETSDATITLPSEAALSKVVTSNGGPAVVSAVTQDSVGWTYQYTDLQLQNGSEFSFSKVTVNGPDGFNQVYVIDPKTLLKPNTVTSVTDPIGRTTSYQYDGYFRPTRITAPEGNYVQITYDFYGNVTNKTAQPKSGSGLSPISKSSSINQSACDQNRVLCFRPTTYTDARGYVTDYAFDPAGRLISEIAPADANGIRRATYLTYGFSYTAPSEVRVCALGSTCGTSSEFKTQYTYFGQTALPLSETRIDGVQGVSLTTTFGYDNAGRLLVKDGPLAGSADAEYYRYDVLGRKTWEISAASDTGSRIAKRFTYRDADDKIVAVETGWVMNPDAETMDITSRTDTIYSATRHPVREAVSSGGVNYSVTDRSFDSRGRPVCQTARMNLAALPAASADACIASSAGSQGGDRISKNIYDAANQMVTMQKAYGTSLQQDYATYTYTSNGKQASVRDAKGNLASMTLDGHDRQIRWNFPSKTSAGSVDASDYEQYSYDASGNRTTLRKRDGSVLTYQYDAMNRLTLKTVPERAGLAAIHTRDVYYGYDIRGLQIYARFDGIGGDGIANAYDSFGRPVSATQTMDGISRTLNYQWDANGNRTQLTYPEGNYFGFGYDPANRMSTIGRNAPSGLTGYGYNSLGLRNSVSSGSWTYYGYDPISRPNTLTQDIVGATYDVTFGFGYNPASQMTSRSTSNDNYVWTGDVNVSRNYAVNGLNQYISAGPATFSYDANGNLTGDGSSTYVYDVENRLVSAGGGSSASLRYDPLGRLYETGGGAAGTTRFLYDGDELVAEYNGSGAMLRRYVHGSGSDDPMAWFEGASVDATVARLIKTNHQGSVIALTDWYGNLTNINSYDEWGIPAAANTGRFQYTGQAWISELRMYHYKARIYSPTLGRFLQSDPVGYKDGLNIYAYVGNDPVNMVDPTGMYKCEGSPAQCNAFESGLRAARRAARDAPTGTRVPSSNLRAAVNFFGKNDGKGPSITFKGEKQGTLGTISTDRQSVNFDFKQIGDVAKATSSAVGKVFGAAVAHEGAHGQQAAPDTPGQRYSNEFGAFTVQAYYYKYSGISDPSQHPIYDTVTGVNKANIKTRAFASCSSALLGTSQAASDCGYYANQ